MQRFLLMISMITLVEITEAGCEEDLDNFLRCANESDLFCGAFAGAVCEMEAEVLADCGAPVH
jgi:hypothetical protein